MTMILPLLSDPPIDLLLVGEGMRDAALSWPMTDAAGLTSGTAAMSLVASVSAGVGNTPSIPVMGGLSAYAPRAADMATTFDGMNVALPTAARVNGSICTPDGVTMPFVVADNCMSCFTPQSTGRWVLAIQTQDVSGAAVGGCRVVVFDVGQLAVGLPAVAAESVSDGSGSASVPVPQNTGYMVLAYLPGSPDRAGVSVQTLSPDAV